MEQDRAYTLALVGNPNSGKSSVFNQLTGLRQKVGNFPGVTVERKMGSMNLEDGRNIRLIDYPGAYSLYPTSEDERIVLRVLSNPQDPDFPDAVVYIADIHNLEKHFLLLTQIIDLDIPVILALNMMDEAVREGIDVKCDVIEKELKIPVVQISGRHGDNIDLLRQKIAGLMDKDHNQGMFYRLSKEEMNVATAVEQQQSVRSPYHALLLAHHYETSELLTEDQREMIQAQLNGQEFPSLSWQIAETMKRYDQFVPLIQKAIIKPSEKENSFSDRVDNVLLNRYLGPIIFFLVMLLVFQAIYAWASYPMEWIESGISLISQLVQRFLPDSWFTDLLTEGILAGLGGVLVFIPQIAILFFLISLLEDMGYMARAVFIFDRIMQKFGLNGRSIVALISGGACAIPAIMTTRTISNWKERLTTIMVTPLISCSARIPVFIVLIGLVVPQKRIAGVLNFQGLAFMGLYLLGIAAALGSAWVFKKVLQGREGSYLMIQLPEYRPPIWKNVLHTVKEKVWTFIVEAGKIIMVVSLVLWFMASYGPGEEMTTARLEALEQAEQLDLSATKTADLVAAKKIEASYAGHLGKFIEPVIEPLGFDWKIGIALITSFAAREVFVGTMATIYSIGSEEDEFRIQERMAREVNIRTGKPVYTLATSMSLLIFYLFAMQCMSTLAVVKKETHSWKWPIIQFFYMSALAYLSSLLVYQLLT